MYNFKRQKVATPLPAHLRVLFPLSAPEPQLGVIDHDAFDGHPKFVERGEVAAEMHQSAVYKQACQLLDDAEESKDQGPLPPPAVLSTLSALSALSVVPAAYVAPTIVSPVPRFFTVVDCFDHCKHVERQFANVVDVYGMHGHDSRDFRLTHVNPFMLAAPMGLHGLFKLNPVVATAEVRGLHRLFEVNDVTGLVLSYLDVNDAQRLVKNLEWDQLDPRLCTNAMRFIRRAMAVRGCEKASWQARQMVVNDLTEVVGFLWVRWLQGRVLSNTDRCAWDTISPDTFFRARAARDLVLTRGRDGRDGLVYPWAEFPPTRLRVMWNAVSNIFSCVTLTGFDNTRGSQDAANLWRDCVQWINGPICMDRAWRRDVLDYSASWWGFMAEWDARYQARYLCFLFVFFFLCKYRYVLFLRWVGPCCLRPVLFDLFAKNGFFY